jgi:putative transposase
MAKVKGYDLDTSAHAVFSLYYHIIFVTKYRRKAMHSEAIRERMKEIMRDLAPGLKILIVSQELADDHIHLLIRGTPSTDLVQVTNTLKGVSSRYLRQEFPEIKNLLWGDDSFWSDSKFIATTGQVSLNVLMKYVESQNEPKKK